MKSTHGKKTKANLLTLRQLIVDLCTFGHISAGQRHHTSGVHYGSSMTNKKEEKKNQRGMPFRDQHFNIETGFYQRTG